VVPPANAGQPEPIRNLPENTGAGLPASVPLLRESVPAVTTGWRQNVAPLPPALAGGPDLPGLLRALKRRWFLALSLGSVCAAAVAAAVYCLMPPKYTAFTQIHLDSIPPFFLTPDPDAARQFNMYQSTQAAKLKSRFVLNAALRRDDVRALPTVQAQAEPVLWLEDELKVEFKEGQEFLTLTMSLPEPDAVVTIVGAVAQAYLQEVNDQEPKRRSQRQAELEDYLAKINQTVKKKKELFKQRADEIGTSDGPAVVQKQVNLLAELGNRRALHAGLRADLLRAETKLKTYEAQKPVGDLVIPESVLKEAVAADAYCQTHLARLSRVQDVLDEYGAGAKNPEAEPTYRQAKGRLVAIQKELDVRIAKIREEVAKRIASRVKGEYEAGLAQLRTEAGLAADNEKRVGEEVEALRKESEKIGTMSTEMEMLRGEIELEGKVAKEIDEKAKTLGLELRAPSRVSLAQEAGLQKKDLKRFLLMLILGPLAVFGAICFGVAWLEFRARRIRSADEVRTGLGMRVVGAVPALMPPRRAADGAEDVEDHALLESIDGIRTLLLKNASIEATRVIMVTSAVAGEGKTTLASHLATSLTRAGRKTLLIDCDLRRPAVHQLFELPQQPGLSEVLLNEVHVAEATCSTTIDGLWVIPAGQWDRSVMAALARNGVEDIFEKLKSEYDFIVIDSHPVMPANDSLLIGQHVDTVLLSLLRDVSQAPRVYAACQRLSTLGIRILGAVVNGMPQDDYYGYHDAAQPARAA
jgi:succinoglycan biosynthesis transport protein ExoP